MLKILTTILLICAITLAGSNTVVFAQPSAAAVVDDKVTAKTAKPKPDLKQVFDTESAKFKKESSEFNVARAEKERIKQATSGGLSKKEKTFLALFAVGIAVLVVLLIKYGKECKTTSPPDCNIGSDDNCYCKEYEEESLAVR